jgi:hypothetical protein
MNPDMRPKRREDLNVRVIDGATVVLDRRANFIHQLNEVATDIWDLCDGVHTPAEIVDEVRAAFDVDAAMAERDVLKTLHRFEEVGLLEKTLAAR